MNFVDVIFFQAEIAPEKLALVAHGSVIPYGRFAQGILSAQQRLSAIGLTEGQTVGVHVVHPIDHLVLICALHRMKVASANITNAVDLYLENVQFDTILADNILPTVSSKQPAAKFVLVAPSWFQDRVTFTVAQRTGSRRTAADWVTRIACYPKGSAQASVVKTTSRALEVAVAFLLPQRTAHLGPHDYHCRPAHEHRLFADAGGFMVGAQCELCGHSECSKHRHYIQTRLSGCFGRRDWIVAKIAGGSIHSNASPARRML